MDREKFKKFTKFYVDNEECQEKVRELRGNDEAISAYLKSIGHEISASDLHEFRRTIVEFIRKNILHESDDISDEDLAHVAGGFIFKAPDTLFNAPEKIVQKSDDVSDKDLGTVGVRC